jgi:hypothetical protein
MEVSRWNKNCSSSGHSRLGRISDGVAAVSRRTWRTCLLNLARKRMPWGQTDGSRPDTEVGGIDTTSARGGAERATRESILLAARKGAERAKRGKKDLKTG